MRASGDGVLGAIRKLGPAVLAAGTAVVLVEIFNRLGRQPYEDKSLFRNTLRITHYLGIFCGGTCKVLKINAFFRHVSLDLSILCGKTCKLLKIKILHVHVTLCPSILCRQSIESKRHENRGRGSAGCGSILAPPRVSLWAMGDADLL